VAHVEVEVVVHVQLCTLWRWE